jgi:hypothetical protein
MVQRRRWLSVPALLGVALVSSGHWHASGSYRQAILEERTPGRADRVAGELNRPAAAPTDALERLADAESARRSGAAIEPESLAALDLQRFASLFAIGVVDREYGLRWIQTRSPASLSMMDLQSVEQACDVLLRRPIEPIPTLVDRRELPAGGLGFVMAVPVLHRGQVTSFVVGLFLTHP